MGKLWVRVKNIFDHSNKGSTKNYFVKSQKFKNFIKMEASAGFRKSGHMTNKVDE